MCLMTGASLRLLEILENCWRECLDIVNGNIPRNGKGYGKYDYLIRRV